jgi:hypothetical protein
MAITKGRSPALPLDELELLEELELLDDELLELDELLEDEDELELLLEDELLEEELELFGDGLCAPPPQALRISDNATGALQ